MLTMNNVSKIYHHRGKPVHALDEANVNIQQGDFVSVVGPSGCGKSTLLLMLGGMLSPTSGTIQIKGTSVYDLSPNQKADLRKKHIGFVFQKFNLIPYLTAFENVQIPLLVAGVSEEDKRSKAEQALQRVGLGDRMDHKPSELSGGQQQRVALARMLVNDPDIILADEPTGNLDPETAGHIVSFFEEFNKEGKTIVMVTHDPSAAAKAKTILHLSNGKIIQKCNSDIRTAS